MVSRGVEGCRGCRVGMGCRGVELVSRFGVEVSRPGLRGGVLLAPHRAPSVRTGALNEGRPAQGLCRSRSAPSAVSRSHAKGTQWEILAVSFSLAVPQRNSEEGPQHQIWHLPRASLFESESYFLLGPVGTLTTPHALVSVHSRTTRVQDTRVCVSSCVGPLRAASHLRPTSTITRRRANGPAHARAHRAGGVAHLPSQSPPRAASLRPAAVGAHSTN